MPIKLKPRPTLPPFTFSPSPPAQADLSEPPADASPSEKDSRPPTDFFPERDMHVFGAYPLGGREEIGRGLVRCGKCAKVTMEASFGEHQRICKHVLEGSPLVAKRATSGKTIKSESSKKRRASEESEDGPSRKRPNERPINTLASGSADDAMKAQKLKKSDLKKLKKERERLVKKEQKEREKAEAAERRRLRTSGPINLDRHCGVINDKGQPCARSLTCKSHAVGAKRAVAGRSDTFDNLFNEWQRINNPNFKESTKSVPGKKVRLAGPGGVGGPGGGGSGGGAGGGGGSGGGAGGKKDGRNRPEDEDGGRMMGENEVRELVHFARMAGERCKLVVGLIGGYNPPPPPLPPPTTKKKDAHDRQANRNRQRYILPRPTMCDSTWNSQLGFGGVGETLVQALAARPTRPPMIINLKPGGGKGGDARRGSDIPGGGDGGKQQKAAGGVTGQGQVRLSGTGKSSGPGSIAIPTSIHPSASNQSIPIQTNNNTHGPGHGQQNFQIPMQMQLHIPGNGTQVMNNAQAMLAAAAQAAQAVNTSGGGNGAVNGNVHAMGMMQLQQQYQQGLLQQQQMQQQQLQQQQQQQQMMQGGQGIQQGYSVAG